MLKEKIEEVNEIIRKKVLDGDYEFISCDEYTAKVSICGLIINIWIANNKSMHCRVWSIYRDYEQDIEFNTDEERIKVWDALKPFVEKYRKEKLKKEKLDLIEQLQSEIDTYEV